MNALSRLSAAARRSGGSLPALRSRPFRLLASGQLISNLGDGLYAVALPWYVLSHHGGAVLLATVLAAYGIPRTCLILVGGHLSDRFSPWVVMMTADIGRLALAGGLAALAATRQPDLATLAPIAFGLGAGEGLFLPASYAIMPRLVADDELQSGNALLSASTQLAVFAGPAVGGAVVATLSAAAGFGLDALSFGISALTLWRLGAVVVARRAAQAQAQASAAAAGPTDAPAGEANAANADGGASTRAFLTFVKTEPLVRLIIAIDIAANLGSAGTSEVALPLLAREHLHATATGYGVLIAAFGIGALAGSLAAARFSHARRPAIPAGFMFLAQTPLMACLPLVPDIGVGFAMLAVWGVLNMWANVMTQTAFQRWAPPEMLGRLSGLLLTASFGMFPVSVALAGFVSHRYGPSAFFLLAAVTVGVTLIWALSCRSFRDFGMTAKPDLAAESEPVPSAG